MSASDYLDDYDASATDILLAIVTEVADTLRAKLSVELKDNLIKALEFMQRAVEILKTTEDEQQLMDAQEVLTELQQEMENP